MDYSVFNRYALYFLPPADAALSEFGARWLGWSIDEGREVELLVDLPDNHATITATARNYGFHGTLKPPFRLKNGYHAEQLHHAAAKLVATLPQFVMPRLELTNLHGFLALRPKNESGELNKTAEKLVCDLDHFRGSPSNAEIQRRRNMGLTPRQDTLMMHWGYPFVLDEFRFHLTLTNRLPHAEVEAVRKCIQSHLHDQILAPQTIDNIGFAGEKDDGTFHLIERLPLASS